METEQKVEQVAQQIEQQVEQPVMGVKIAEEVSAMEEWSIWRDQYYPKVPAYSKKDGSGTMREYDENGKVMLQSGPILGHENRTSGGDWKGLKVKNREQMVKKMVAALKKRVPEVAARVVRTKIVSYSCGLVYEMQDENGNELASYHAAKLDENGIYNYEDIVHNDRMNVPIDSGKETVPQVRSLREK